MSRLSKVGAAALAAFGWTGGASVSASYLVVAGGGAGGVGYGAGGGAGGYQTGTTSLNPTLSYAVTVGAGGAFPASGNGANGSNSQLGTLTASVGGGGGGSGSLAGNAGGSGGGGGANGSNTAGGTATSGQGNAGGTGNNSVHTCAGGGGGAGAVGNNGNSASNIGGDGGVGLASSISGTSTYYAGGGGGYGSTGGAGGNGGGGQGGSVSTTSGTANTGGGGGNGSGVGIGNGGSGVVIISYVGAQQFGGGVVTSSGGNTIHTFTTSGTLSPITSLSASYLVVAGGGGAIGNRGGGAGGGGLLTGSGLTIDSNSTYLVTVGAGGAGGTGIGSVSSTQDGTGSSFLAYSATGGGGAGGTAENGRNGGSGGGGGASSTVAGSGGTGNTPSTTPSQGTNGGTAIAYSSGSFGAGGGGGGGGSSGVAGSSASGTTAGNGGNGTTASAALGSGTYAGGGGGGGGNAANSSGGSGGGGAGAWGGTGLPATQVAGTSGTANTGGGGGGGSNYNTTAVTQASGGSGVVIISYAGATQLMAGGTVTISGGNVIHTFTSTGYLAPLKLVSNSLRFRSSASAYLGRTPAVSGNRRTWTFSAWIKRGTFGTFAGVFGVQISSNGAYASVFNCIRFTDANVLSIFEYDVNTATTFYRLDTTQVFRDPAAWYHIVFAFDSTQATSSNRWKLYVNGTQVTAFSSTTYPSQNYETNVNTATKASDIGLVTNVYLDGYLTEINLIDGQALTPNSFGTINSYGVWQPITYGGSYGINGFYLPFTNQTSATTLAYDFSPQGNNWTPNNISTSTGVTYDSMTDVPTLTSATAANYAVLNPLYVVPSSTMPTFSDGNLKQTQVGGEGVNTCVSVASMPFPTSGKWYCEVTFVTAATSSPFRTRFGIQADAQINNSMSQNAGKTQCFDYSANGNKGNNNAETAYGNTYTSGDTIGMAVDLDNGKIWWSRNGTFQASGDPAAGTNAAYTTLVGSNNYFTSVGWFATSDINFGQRPFSTTPPTGFLALNTYNL